MYLSVLIFTIPILFQPPAELDANEKQRWALSDLSQSNSMELRKQLIRRHHHVLRNQEIIHKDRCLNKIKNGKILMSESQKPFDGQVRGKVGFLNLLQVKNLSEARFLTLLHHEMIHLSQHQKVSEDINGIRALFEEGQATYGSMNFYSSFTIEDILDWNSKHREKISNWLCQHNWGQEFFNHYLQELFIPEKTPLKDFPRLGYWLGSKIFAHIAQGREWCQVSFAEFSMRFNKTTQDLKLKICRGSNAQAISL